MAKEGTETVQIWRATTDRYGDTTETRIVATCRRCIIWPRAGGESDTGRGVVTIEGHNIWVPSGRTTWEETVPEADRHLKTTDDVVLVSRGDLRRYVLEGSVGDWRKNGRKLGFLFSTRRRA